jgi:hypothetical protein
VHGPGAIAFVLTVAVLTNWPAFFGFTLIVTVAEAPLASVPMVQVTLFDPLHEPWLGVEETKSI